jgi:hypothetical protein
VAAVLAALLIGILIGALLRPFIEAYLEWRTARLHAQRPVEDERVLDDRCLRRPRAF